MSRLARRANLGPKVAAAVFTAFNPADKGANIVLSNSNRTAATPGAVQEGARGDTFKSSGNLHLEFTLGAGMTSNSVNVGIANPGADLTLAGTTATSAVTGFCGFVGSRFYHSTGFASPGTLAAGTNVAIEMDATQVWYKVGAGARDGPYLHGLATYTPTARFNSSSPAGDVTLNTGQAAFVVAVEPGFVAFG